MRKSVLVILIGFFLVFSLPAEEETKQTQQPAKTVDQLLNEVAKMLSIPSIQGEFKVTLKSKKGDEREIKARAYQKTVGNSEIKRLFIFDFPARVRGTSLLLHSYYDGRPNNMWIYLPTVKRVKRIALESSGGGYFMGSDFTYRDLINLDRNDMNFEMLEEKEINGIESYAVKSWGKTDEIRQELGYSYYISYYNKKNSEIHRREYFDFNKKLLKVYEVKEYYVSGAYHYPTKLSMTNVQTEHKSIIEVTEVSIKDIPEKIFTTNSLKGN